MNRQPVRLRADDAPFRRRTAGPLPGTASLPRFQTRTTVSTRRKNVIVIGNCHADIVHAGLRQIPNISKYFNVQYQNVIFIPLRSYLQLRHQLRQCDLAIVQDIGDWEAYPLRNCIPDSCEIVKFPCVHFASLWPFDEFNGLMDPEATAIELARLRARLGPFQRLLVRLGYATPPNPTFAHLDGLLGRLRREIPDPAARLAAYRSLHIRDVPNILRTHDFETRRLAAMDKKFDCKIGQFILENFRNSQLLYSTNRPNGQIFKMIIVEIMRRLGVRGEVPDIPDLSRLHVTEVPVHPEVAAELGVAWAMPERTYRLWQQNLTWEQYVCRYIEWYG